MLKIRSKQVCIDSLEDVISVQALLSNGPLCEINIPKDRERRLTQCRH